MKMVPMKYQIKKLSFGDHLLETMATDLLSEASHSAPFDLSDCLVLLPSARACRSLGHALLEKCGLDALLLPRTVTLDQLTEERAAALGLATRPCPEDSLRQIRLAHALEDLAWLRERPESAPGLAREFLTFFDEARLAGCPELLEGGEGVTERVLATSHPAAAEVHEQDLQRVAEVWQLYRQLIPWDAVDIKVAVASPVTGGPAIRQLLVGGFGKLEVVQARLIQQLMGSAAHVHLYDLEGDSNLARFYLATWGEGQRHLDPLAASGQVLARLAGLALAEIRPANPTADGTLQQRLAGAGDMSRWWAPLGPLELAACSDPEQESRLVAHHVVRILSEPAGVEQRTAVVTNDPDLAERITAQLRDAGIDVDNTLGRPLSAQPAGLLLRFILRAVLTGLRPEALLEVLTHPYAGDGEKPARRESCLLRLENDLRRRQLPPSGPDELLAMARHRDEAATTLTGNVSSEMEDFTASFLAGFAPLLDLGRGSHQARHICQALRSAWSALAARTPLTEDPGRADVTGLDRLLSGLERGSDFLPALSLARFTADLNRLLSGTNVPAHRSQGLPVQVAGLVEARLERFDNLIVAGLNEGKFPARGQRPLFLDSRVRGELGLPTRRDSLARDAELFLRLLHNAPRVILTWSRTDGDQDLLPSPLLERLLLSRDVDETLPVVSQVPLWRAGGRREVIPSQPRRNSGPNHWTCPCNSKVRVCAGSAGRLCSAGGSVPTVSCWSAASSCAAPKRCRRSSASAIPATSSTVP
jgi:ATP-dependent helicase/nuclease subunit B